MSERPFDQDEVLESALRLAVAGPAPAVGHPSSEELLDYHLRALPPEDAERIQVHLGRCVECAQLVLDCAAFSDPDAPAPQVSKADLDRGWNELQARRSTSKEARARSGAPTIWALAASLLLSVSLLGWALSLRRELSQAEGPRGDVVSAYLQPEGAGTRRAGDAPPQLPIPPEVRWVSLSLNLGDVRTDSIYRVELLSSGGERLWSASGIPRAADGTFSLLLPAKLLLPGGYRLRLASSPKEGGQATVAADYHFTSVLPQPTPLP